MTLNGVVVPADVVSMAPGVLSRGLPGMLRLRPVLSGGDSGKHKQTQTHKSIIKSVVA